MQSLIIKIIIIDYKYGKSLKNWLVKIEIKIQV